MVGIMKTSRDYKILARQRMFKTYGTLAGGTAIYGAIYVAVVLAIMVAYTLNLLAKGVFASIAEVENYMETSMNSLSFFFISQVVMVLVGALMSTLSVAIQYMCLKTARAEKASIADLLYVVKNNPDKVIIIYVVQQLFMFLFALPSNLLSIVIDTRANIGLEMVHLILMILGYVADIIIVALFSQAMFLYIDNPEESSLKCIEMSYHVMAKHMGRYILLFISFIPLQILAAFTFGIMYLWVLPYQYTAFALFYMQLKGELGSTIDVTIQ